MSSRFVRLLEKGAWRLYRRQALAWEQEARERASRRWQVARLLRVLEARIQAEGAVCECDPGESTA